ncbi:MAG: hypothetical protein LBH75_03475 [Treponema sp.]|jgi:hypothetical protein|nr:hypothetical protein [Treponema sp.]
MNDENRDLTSIKLAEIERLIQDFKKRFEAGTSDTKNFISMMEIERMWIELQNNTHIIYSDFLEELMSNVDEHKLIRKKKENTDSRE